MLSFKYLTFPFLEVLGIESKAFTRQTRALPLNYTLSLPQRVFNGGATVISNSDISNNCAVSKSAADQRFVSSAFTYLLAYHGSFY